MNAYPKCILKPGKEAAVMRRHPWIFSGAVMKTEPVQEGDVVEVFSAAGKYLATGHYSRSSITIKIISFEQQEINKAFWKKKILDAYELRKSLGLTDNNLTNAYRIVHSEGDGVPGVIIDWYNGTAVIQIHSWGMYQAKFFLSESLQEIYGDQLKAVYNKSFETLKSQLGQTNIKIPEDGYLYGKHEDTTILESGHVFHVNWEAGQKTGFFLDQRINRMLVQSFAQDKTVLNCFCYSGAFSVYALKGGAKHVMSVDSSRQAIDWTEENMRLNNIDPARHHSVVVDVKRFIADTDEKFDLIILDPPAFAKHHHVTNNALKAYAFINARAMEKLNPGGILFTFSCSQAISREMFQSAIHSAAIETGKNMRILHRLSQGADHPAGIYHPEGDYLKGLVLGNDFE